MSGDLIRNHQGDMLVLDENGNALRRADKNDDGQVVSDRMQTQASLVGILRLLEEVAKKDDDPHYRRAARTQADALKMMIKRTRHGGVLTEAEILGPVLEERKRPALPGPARGFDVIDVETK